MPDREYVARRLGELSAFIRSQFDGMIGTQACELYREWAVAAEQAAGMLKAQEPRLLTAEDFHGNPDLDDGGGLPCWKEARKETRRSGWAVICYGKWLADTAEPAGAYCAARYWTARPSDEQREAAPWE